MKKRISMLLTICLLLLAASCGKQPNETATTAATDPTETRNVSTTLSKIDNTAWQYHADDDVYYQLGVSYCANPADASYETLAVFVPGAYMTATENGDGTYTCALNDTADVNGYTAATAPIVMPINTPGYSAQTALTDYKSVTDYTSQGFVYVHAGCRGRDAGAPAGVTDLKAAVRYLRYCDDVLAGDAESIFTFGMSGGGAQSAVMGATGDSDLYTPYLTAIGAVEGVSDAVLGSMCWCPITNLDSADMAYEWMMGSTRSGLSEDEQEISDALAKAFADYINRAQLTDENGTVLVLEESEAGIYQAGSYYEFIKAEIEESLNNFLADTSFPYDASSSSGKGGMGGGAPSGGMPDGERPDGGDGEKPDFANGEAPDFANGEGPGSGAESETSIEDADQITRNSTSSGVSLSGTYETAEDYIDALNANGAWVTYDADTNTATITGVADFVAAFKTASKNLGAFDQMDAGQGENTLFGYGDGNGAHFDSYLATILSDLGSDAAEDYAADLQRTDAAGNTAETRVNMYTPLYYLLSSSEGYGTSTVAKYWRIRSGIAQSDTALTTEANLALALENTATVESVDYAAVWGEGHTEAERTGGSTENFIAWVNDCMAG